MFSQRIRRVMERERMLTAPPQTTVREAALLMAGANSGAVLVVEGETLTGIFTERDMVFRVIARGLDPATTTLQTVMTAAPITVDPERSFGHALSLMHSNGFRHLPVVADGKLQGIVSARDALDPELEEFVCEAQRRVAIR